MSNNKLKKILIANRGEIALRIQRASVKRKIPSAITISEADNNTLFAREATEKVLLSGIKPQDTYANIEKVIEAAKKSGCNAIHPGYGFLSENGDFAERVTKEEMIFIGPPAEVIRKLGDKLAARDIAKKAGVSITAGGEIGIAEPIYPIIIKAVAGGGGRGMRIVHSKEELEKQLPNARAEAGKNFGNDKVYFEQFIENPRHVEVQIFGDMHGNVVHFGTRDCSTQRRHQKVIEEAPAPFLSTKLRKEIEDAAVAIAKAANYVNAGTAEFLVKEEKFYFLEMNTRIQVEHPVTEMITGVDLVDLQLAIAEGERLPFKQSDIKFSGHAIEFRLYAEDPETNFMPAKGTLTELSVPSEKNVRFDSGFIKGDTVTLFYDAMLAKIIVHEKNRAEAINLSDQILKLSKCEGVKNNLAFVRWITRHTKFREAPFDIKYVEREFSLEKMSELEAGDVLDPEWREPQNGVEFCETIDGITLLHRKDGVFIAATKDGKRVASNGKNTALKAIF